MTTIRTFLALSLLAAGPAAFAQVAPSAPTTAAPGPAASAPAAASPSQAGTRIMMLRWFVADIERATKFYESVLGMNVLQRMGGKVRVMGFPGGVTPGLILIESPEEERMNGSFIVLVDDVQATLARAFAAGGTLMNTRFGQVMNGVQARSSHFVDPDGNVVEVLQMRPPRR